jgi:replicative DNA helicase
MTAHDIDAERHLLGACMAIEFADAYRLAAEIITTRDFYQPAHAEIWDAIAALHSQGIPSDPVLVADQLADRLERVGGRIYLAQLYGNVITATNVTHHARLIADAATLRRCELAGSAHPRVRCVHGRTARPAPDGHPRPTR